jgi:hypothetical protein
MASTANSVSDAHLGLTNEEIHTLRRHQAIALSQTGSSRVASQASSAGRLLVDPSSLAALSNYFDRLMYSIQQRWQAVSSEFCREDDCRGHRRRGDETEDVQCAKYWSHM